ncbi:malto-oligosyltrehalose trehalohydrolase [Leptolyngbya ohadii]|uniref:malto-oligosyltrehalose trehalohydrolase n=1 Tax=Leptolyngbya ohadii TaxID=1962290 RepID=UPI000B59DC9B|nr:malto-oligosyltrehalose trehalohydrolase [Leptolyngbya ohadii]
MQIGSRYLGNGQCHFIVWSPLSQQVELHLVSPEDKLIPLEKDDQGYWQTTIAAEPGTLYFYRLNGEVDRPDPASQSQPQGVHGPSEVVDQGKYTWNDGQWQGIPLDDWIIYEMHVGTFTPEGTFDAMISRIPELLELGVNVIEIMPIAQFPGDRNWGYDGVYPYGVQQSYGGVDGLKRLVDACHQQGMAVILDVVYNHMGPEGNYFSQFAPYFTDRYKTPWGSAINYDDAYSDEVRNYFIENVRYWLSDYHLDGLRMDAIHAIYDFGAKHILQEMADAANQIAQETGRKIHLIAESDLNDPRIIRSSEAGGYGIHAQWCDDFHHSLRTILTKESHGYYADYGDLDHLARAYRDSFVYAWTYSPSRKRKHGSSAIDCPTTQFVICSQNHDQVGNRMLGDRLTEVVSFEALKIAAAAVLLSPCIPMLFMGEEYGEEAPFQYFVSHGDPGLVEAVRKGRKEEFAAFHAEGEAPDPQSEDTFQRSKLNWDKRHEGKHKTLWQFYQTLIRMRQQIPALAHKDRDCLEAIVLDNEQVLMLRRWFQDQEVVCLFNVHQKPVELSLSLADGNWKKLLDSSDAIWGGSGSPTAEIVTVQPSQPQTFQLNPESVVVYSK